MTHRLLVPPQGVQVPIRAAAAADLYIYEDIGGGPFSNGLTAKDVVDALQELKKSGAKALSVRINSIGGSVFEGLAMYQAITNWDGPKITYIDGLAASIASVIALAGDKVYASEPSKMMIHEAWGGVAGTAAEMRKAAELVEKANDTIVGIYSSRTGVKDAELRSLMAAETWMTADEAKSKGFITDVLRDERKPVAAKWNPVLRMEVGLLKHRLARMSNGSKTTPSEKDTK